MSDFNDQIIAEFRANGGSVATAGFGDSLILVHHYGAKSGTERITPLVAIRLDDDTWLIAASKAGAPDNPDWYYNLIAHPDTEIETPDGEVAVRAKVLEGAARDDAWKMFTDQSAAFAEYASKTDRTIPVVELKRRAGTSQD